MKTSVMFKAIVTLAITLASVWSMQAATDVWTAGDSTGLWNDPANWAAAAVPAAGDTVNFTNMYNAQGTITLNQSYPSTGTGLATLNFNYGTSLAITTNGASNCYLYVTTAVNVNDANTYTINLPAASNEGFVPKASTTLTVAAGGTLNIETAFTAVSGVTGGNVNKAGAGTLNLGNGTANGASQYLQLNAQAGLTQLGFTSGVTVNGIAGISAGATVQIATANTKATMLSSASYMYQAGVAAVAGTFDLNGYNQQIASLGGTSTGLVTDNGSANSTLTIGAGGVVNRSETSATFAGVIQDGSSGTISLAINATNSGFIETLSGANTYSGSTTVSRGTLKAGVASVAGVSGAFGKNSAVTLANSATAALALNGYNTQIGSLTGGGAAGGNVTNAAATLTVGGDNTSPAAYAGVISGTGGLIKIGTGKLTLSGTNTYSGNTYVNSGSLALTGSGSISNTPLISVTGSGAILDVSGLTTAFVLGSGQTLSNSASATALLGGSLNAASGTISLTYAAGTPSMNVTNGTLTLSSGTTFKINNTGTSLPIGSYLIISTNSGGLVTGSVPAVTVSGGGVAAGWGLQITNGQLYLNVFGQTDNWTGGSGTSGNWSDAANWGGKYQSGNRQWQRAHARWNLGALGFSRRLQFERARLLFWRT